MRIELESGFVVSADRQHFILTHPATERDTGNTVDGRQTYYTEIESLLAAVLRHRLRGSDAATVEALRGTIADALHEIRGLAASLRGEAQDAIFTREEMESSIAALKARAKEEK